MECHLAKLSSTFDMMILTSFIGINKKKTFKLRRRLVSNVQHFESVLLLQSIKKQEQQKNIGKSIQHYFCKYKHCPVICIQWLTVFKAMVPSPQPLQWLGWIYRPVCLWLTSSRSLNLWMEASTTTKMLLSSRVQLFTEYLTLKSKAERGERGEGPKQRLRWGPQDFRRTFAQLNIN